MYSIPDCMLSVFLKKIFCSKDKTHKYFEKQILQTNLLANLLKCNMKVAVVSLLENELLQKKIHKFPIWADILQKGLDIACTNYLSKIDFDIKQSVLKSYRNDNDRRLNGSYALTQVLQYSKADCAKLLLQDTEINPNYTENCGGYFHALVNSDIGLADFQALCRCLLGKGVDVNQKARKSFYAYEEIPPIMRVVYNMTSQDIELDRLDCLVENGADIHATVSSNSSNVVAVAIENLPSEKNVHVLPKLFALGANFQNVNNNRDNALHILFNKVQDSHFQELVNYLIGVGVDISHCDTQAKVPLMYALQNDAGIDCIQTLLQRSPPKYTDRSGQGYFHYLFQSKCGYESFRSSCNVLLEAGEDISLADKEEKVPVFTICENALENIRGYDETSSLLTYFQSVGVDFQVKAESGRNILHHLFSRPVKPKTSITVEASTSHLERKTWSISSEEDASITSIYAFLEKNFNISCFQMDKTGINPLMLAIEHRAEFTCMAELVATKQIPLQNDGNANSYFHYLARSHASDAKYDLIKSALLRNNIPYPASMPERLPHFEEELYY